jgi:hypothetical protein
VRVIADLEKNHSGQVLVSGVSHDAPVEPMAMCSGTSAVALGTVFINDTLRLQSAGKTARRPKAVAMGIWAELALVGLQYPGSSSGGMQQRVSIASAVPTKILMMDEPWRRARRNHPRPLVDEQLQQLWQRRAPHHRSSLTRFHCRGLCTGPENCGHVATSRSSRHLTPALPTVATGLRDSAEFVAPARAVQEAHNDGLLTP